MLDDLAVRYGLTRDKLATICTLRAEGKSWATIARAVGWHAPTLFRHVQAIAEELGLDAGTGCPDLDPNWPDQQRRPRGPILCASYPRCPCGEGTHPQSDPRDGRTVEADPT